VRESIKLSYGSVKAIQLLLISSSYSPLAIAEKQAKDIMNTLFFAIHDIDTLENVLQILDDTKATNIPVTDEQQRFIGMISRTAIAYALKYTSLFPDKVTAAKQQHKHHPQKQDQQADNQSEDSNNNNSTTGSASSLIETAGGLRVSSAGHQELLAAENTIAELSGAHHSNQADITETLDYQFHEQHLHYYLNLNPLIDIGVITVQEETSNKRVHAVMRKIGLSHLCVLNQRHQLKGIITRRNLLKLQEKTTTPEQQPNTEQQQPDVKIEIAAAADHPQYQQSVAESTAPPLPTSASSPSPVVSALVASDVRSSPSNSAVSSVADADGSLVLDDDELISVAELKQRRRLMRRKSTVQRIQMHTKDLR